MKDAILQPQTAHLIGLAGAGMRALAKMLAANGWSVSGSDQKLGIETACAMHALGIKAYQGHAPQKIPKNVDVVIHSAAITNDNTELKKARSLNCEVLSYPEMLGRISRSKTTLAVAGTHGKTTTCAMIDFIFQFAKKNCYSLFGGEYQNRDSDTHKKISPETIKQSTKVVQDAAQKESVFLVEACEYRKHFLNLSPTHAIILGIEPDHFDSFESWTQTESAFVEFAASIPKTGTLLIHGDNNRDTACREKIEQSSRCCIETFGMTEGFVDGLAGQHRAKWGWTAWDWTATKIETLSFSTAAVSTHFEVWHRGQFLSHITMPIAGKHNVLNALAAIAMAMQNQIPIETIKKALRKFSGVKRRLERLADYQGVIRFDDYAHHPTAVQLTLQTIREQYPNQTIISVFQPHQVSRTVALMDEFANALKIADRVIIAKIFAAREKESLQTTTVAKQLSKRVCSLGTPSQFVPTLDQIALTLEDNCCHAGDVLVTMGAGNIDWVGYELTRKIQRNHAS